MTDPYRALRNEKEAWAYRTEAAALEASIRHWERIVAYIESVPRFVDLDGRFLEDHASENYCALCITHDHDCWACILGKTDSKCTFSGTPYREFWKAFDSGRNKRNLVRAAKRMLNTLKECRGKMK